MYITCNNIYSNSYTIQNKSNRKAATFTSNPKSARLLFENADFFINIKGYGRNEEWAKEVVSLTDTAAKMIREKQTSDEVLISIANDMKSANRHCSDDKFKMNHTGVLRTTRVGFGYPGIWANKDIQTCYDTNFRNTPNEPYSTYKDRFDAVMRKPLKNPYDGICLTRMDKQLMGSYMVHGKTVGVNNALDRVWTMYDKLQNKYIQKPEKVTNEHLEEINSDIAEIRWIMAHATPWERGSDSISNSFMRALYKSMGIKTYPAKQGVSFDLEAYCTELGDYKKNFATYFEKPPEIID